MPGDPIIAYDPDLLRGNWVNPRHYFISCLGLALRADLFSITWINVYNMPINSLMVFFVALALYVIPIFFLQSFLGQFSSSGFISAFRISPIAKGIGYASLFSNIIMISYSSIFMVIPLQFLLYSFDSPLPWSQESIDNLKNASAHKEKMNVYEISNNLTTIYKFVDAKRFVYHIPASLFLNNHIAHRDVFGFEDNSNNTSVMLFFINLIIWSLILQIFYFWYDVRKMGTILCHGIVLTIILLFICMMRFYMLPNSTNGKAGNLYPEMEYFIDVVPSMMIFSLSTLGSGWFSVISLSSYNHFKRNLHHDSLIICTSQMVIAQFFGMTASFLENHFIGMVKNVEYDKILYRNVDHYWILYIASSTVISEMHLSNMWSILYYAMLFLASLISTVIQLFSLYTSICDEFITLRRYRQSMSFGFISLCAMLSSIFCDTDAILHFSKFATCAFLSQIVGNLLLVIAVLFLYGYKKTKRDLKFMFALPKYFDQWAIGLMRFVTPLCLACMAFSIIHIIWREFQINKSTSQAAVSFFNLIPCLALSCYINYVLYLSYGTLTNRFGGYSIVNEWLPVDGAICASYTQYINRHENETIELEFMNEQQNELDVINEDEEDTDNRLEELEINPNVHQYITNERTLYDDSTSM